MRRLLLVAVSIGWWSIVFRSSGEGASEQWTKRLLQDWFGLEGSALEVTNFIVRKSAHVGYYGVLTFLICLTVWGWVLTCRLRTAVCAAAAAIATGVFDEARQATTLSRSGTALDLLYDCAGVTLAIWLFWRSSATR